MATCTGCCVELRLPNLKEFHAVARTAVLAIASRMNFGYADIKDIELAVGEAFTNAITHGCPPEKGAQVITLRCELEEAALVISIHDPGAGFDPNIVEKAGRQPEPEADSGRLGVGIAVMKSVMDDVRFEASPGLGTTVRLTKKLHLDAQEER